MLSYVPFQILNSQEGHQSCLSAHSYQSGLPCKAHLVYHTSINISSKEDRKINSSQINKQCERLQKECSIQDDHNLSFRSKTIIKNHFTLHVIFFPDQNFFVRNKINKYKYKLLIPTSNLRH